MEIIIISKLKDVVVQRALSRLGREVSTRDITHAELTETMLKLSKETNIPVSTLHRINNCTSNISIETLIRLMMHLELTRLNQLYDVKITYGSEESEVTDEVQEISEDNPVFP